MSKSISWIPAGAEIVIDNCTYGKIVNGILHIRDFNSWSWTNTKCSWKEYIENAEPITAQQKTIQQILAEVLCGLYKENKTYHIFKSRGSLYVSLHYEPVYKGYNKTLYSGEKIYIAEPYTSAILNKLPEIYDETKYASVIGNDYEYNIVESSQKLSAYKKNFPNIYNLGLMTVSSILNAKHHATPHDFFYVIKGRLKGHYIAPVLTRYPEIDTEFVQYCVLKDEFSRYQKWYTKKKLK